MPDPDERLRPIADSDATRPPLAIVDDPASPHGARMARALRHASTVDWIVPSLQLPADLLATRAAVIALPLRVRGASRDDRFTAAIVDALERLRARGCLVFVAQGLRPNLLTEAAIAVTAPIDGSSTTASHACVVAAEAAWLGGGAFTRPHHG
jgi:hypothetical protein